MKLSRASRLHLTSARGSPNQIHGLKIALNMILPSWSEALPRH